MQKCALLADMENLPWPTSETGSDCKTEETLFVLLDTASKDAFAILLARLESGKPKMITADVPERPVIIYTDGAVERKGMQKVMSMLQLVACSFLMTGFTFLEQGWIVIFYKGGWKNLSILSA